MGRFSDLMIEYEEFCKEVGNNYIRIEDFVKIKSFEIEEERKKVCENGHQNVKEGKKMSKSKKLDLIVNYEIHFGKPMTKEMMAHVMDD